MQIANIQVRVDAKLKKQAKKILDGLGVDMTSAVRLFMKEIVQAKKLPLSLKYEDEVDANGLTRKEIAQIKQSYKDALKGKNCSPAFDDVEEALAYLDNLRK